MAMAIDELVFNLKLDLGGPKGTATIAVEIANAVGQKMRYRNDDVLVDIIKTATAEAAFDVLIKHLKVAEET